MPRLFIYIAVILATAALVPPAVIAWARGSTSPNRRIHMVLDMDLQHSFRAQEVNPLFADGRGMRPPVEHTVARGELGLDDHFERGISGDDWATAFPDQVSVDLQLLERGRQRYDIYCAVCHGETGDGQGIVHLKAQALVENVSGDNGGTSWVAPKNLHEDAIAEQPVGKLYNTVTNGVRTMAGYGPQIPTADRWAIVAYLKALQRSQNASFEDIPADQRPRLGG